MLIIVAIIAVLVFISIPLAGDRLEKARVATDSANERSAYGCAVAQYLVDGTFAGQPVSYLSEAAHTSVTAMADMLVSTMAYAPIRLAGRSGSLAGAPETVMLSAQAAGEETNLPDPKQPGGSYTPFTDVTFNPEKEPERTYDSVGRCTNIHDAWENIPDTAINYRDTKFTRNSGQKFDLMVGEKGSFVFRTRYYTQNCNSNRHSYVYRNPKEYCDIHLVNEDGDKSNLIGKPSYAAGTNNQEAKSFDYAKEGPPYNTTGHTLIVWAGQFDEAKSPQYVASQYDVSRVMVTNFEAIKPGVSTKYGVNYRANYWIDYTKWWDYGGVYCKACWRDYKNNYTITTQARHTWFRYQDNFAVTVKARYNLDYDTQGGSQAPEAQTQDVAATTAEFTAAAAPTRNGYTFQGWNTQANGKGEMYAAGATVPVKWSEGFGSTANPVSQTLYAIWEGGVPASTYTVTYTDGVDGEEVFADVVHGNLQAGVPTPAFRDGGNPTRQDYTFLGWSPVVASTVTGDATYTATWEKNTTTDPTTPPGGGEGDGGGGGDGGGPTTPNPSDIDAWYNGATGKWQLTLGEGENKIRPYGKCKDHPDGILGGRLRGGVLTLVWADKDGNVLPGALCHVERSTRLW